MYNSLVISNFFIKKGMDTGVSVTPMKLLKLVYLSHGWHMGYFDNSLISDAVEAWKYGPVIPRVYAQVKGYRANYIYSMIDINSDGLISDNEISTTGKIPEFLDAIWDHYKIFSGLELSTITHEKDSPWDITVKEKGINEIIANDLIKVYYQNKVSLLSN